MWKKDENGNLALCEKGNPIWINGDKEESADYGGMISRLNAVTSESIGRKEQLRLKDEEINNLKKAQASAPNVNEDLKKQLEEKDRELLSIKEKHNDSLLSNAFNTSAFIKDKVAVHPELIRSQFGRNFGIEDGQIVAKDDSGNVIYSATDYGKPASFDEAISRIIEQCPYKDTFLRSSGNVGGGAGNGGGGSSRKWGDYSEIERAQLAKTDPQAFNLLLKTRDEKEK